MNIPTSVYIAKTSPVHACHPGIKLLLLFAYSVCLFWVDSWWGLAAYAVICAVIVVASRVEVSLYAKMLIPVYVMMVFPLVFNGFDPGAKYALRILLLALSSFVMCFTTTPTALLEVFAALLSPLRIVKAPVDDIATTLSLALRFIPEMAVQTQRIHDAQVTRGAPLDDGPVFARIAAWGNVFIPLFVGLFRKADTLSAAMDARCYGAPGVVRTQLGGTRLKASGVVVAVGGVVLLAVIAVMG